MSMASQLGGQALVADHPGHDPAFPTLWLWTNHLSFLAGGGSEDLEELISGVFGTVPGHLGSIW